MFNTQRIQAATEMADLANNTSTTAAHRKANINRLSIERVQTAKSKACKSGGRARRSICTLQFGRLWPKADVRHS